MPPKKSEQTPLKRALRRVGWGAVVVGVLAYAIQGGEYGSFDVVRTRSQVQQLSARADSMRRIVDSLKAEYRTVTTDPMRLERVARERWGMVRGDKELLYWVSGSARPDSGTLAAR